MYHWYSIRILKTEDVCYCSFPRDDYLITLWMRRNHDYTDDDDDDDDDDDGNKD